MQTKSLHGKEVESSFVFYGVFYLAHNSSKLERINERKGAFVILWKKLGVVLRENEAEKGEWVMIQGFLSTAPRVRLHLGSISWTLIIGLHQLGPGISDGQFYWSHSRLSATVSHPSCPCQPGQYI